MKTYFLDTSVIIDYLRGKEEQVTLINELKGKLVSSYICLSELYDQKIKMQSQPFLSFFLVLVKPMDSIKK